MTNSIYLFGPVSDSFTDDSDYFTSPTGERFYFRLSLDVSEKMITLEDSCGRSIPLGIEFIKGLGTGLWAMQEVLNAQQRADTSLRIDLDKIKELIQFWSKNE